MLEARDLRLWLGERLLARLDARIAPGEVLCVMAPSGAGKSSLLLALLGALPPGMRATGQVVLDGRDLTGLAVEARRIGILFQDDVLFPHLSVGQNLLFALPKGEGGSRGERLSIVAQLLDEMDLPGFQTRDPATLSGGQRARVALARALLARPRALLLDEAFARLDPALRGQIRDLVFSHLRDRGLPAILVTHDAEDARAAGGRVVDTQGRDLGGDIGRGSP